MIGSDGKTVLIQHNWTSPVQTSEKNKYCDGCSRRSNEVEDGEYGLGTSIIYSRYKQ